jgi:hypothetical protein
MFAWVTCKIPSTQVSPLQTPSSDTCSMNQVVALVNEILILCLTSERYGLMRGRATAEACDPTVGVLRTRKPSKAVQIRVMPSSTALSCETPLPSPTL